MAICMNKSAFVIQVSAAADVLSSQLFFLCILNNAIII